MPRSPQKTSRSGRPYKKTERLHSPLKKNATKKLDFHSDSSADFDVVTRALCKCQNPHLALCHFKHYSSKKDEWLSVRRLSLSAIEAIPNVPCSASLPCPHRLKVGKGSGLSVLSGSVVVQDLASPEAVAAEFPLAMQFLNNTFASPNPSSKRPKPAVPLFLPSPPPPLPSPPRVPALSLDALPERAGPVDVVFADPVLSLALADSKRKPLPPQEYYQYVPDMEEFLPTLIDSVNLSLSHSFGVGFWNSEGAGTWKVIREEVTASLEFALDNPTELTIFQASINLLLAPSRFLAFLGFTRPVLPTKPNRSPADISTKLASEAVKRGQSGKALRILTGNGAAPHTNDQLKRTADLFPRPGSFTTYTPTDDLLTLDPLFISKKFASLVSSIEPESPDVYGWDPTLFRDQDASVRFIPVVTRFLYAFVGWSHAPPICSQLFAGSSLISIYKLPEAERDLLPLEQKNGIRPIGSQCLFGKMIDRQALESVESKVYKASVMPVQRAFQSRGVPSIPMAALGALKSGFAIAKGDFSNAYQEISRQAALDNLKKVTPALANFFSRALLQDIPLFTRDVNGVINVIWSSTGAPQGSVSGNIVFTAGVSEVFNILRREYPDFFLCAATDDLIQFFKPEIDTPEEWQAQYKCLAEFLRRYEQLSLDLCSLTQNLSKSAIILPLNAPLPSNDVRELFPPSFKFHHVSNVVPEDVLFPNRTDGMVICGAPVGSDFYIQKFVRWKTKSAITKIQAIRHLGNSDLIPTPKHVAFKLLASSGIKLMSYVATVVPPQFTMSYLKKFDNVVRNAFFSLLYPETVDITERVDRSYHRALYQLGKVG